MKKKTQTPAPAAKTVQKREGYIPKITPKAISRTRSDVSTWKAALRAADNVEKPRRDRLQNLYGDIMLDAHLTSQIELRTLPVLATPFLLKHKDGTIDPEQTKTITDASWVKRLNRIILESTYYGHSLVEFEFDDNGALDCKLVPRTNVIPQTGILLLKQADERGVEYRNASEYGTWLLEFGDQADYGLLNKAVPHVLFMRFAQSCWSELCEIYGIPPRFIKTDTTDPEMLNRAESMLRDMGSAAYFIIDNTEEFEFAKGADTNGDVYRNLMSFCKECISVLINTVQVGQDTTNGNRSKEESSIELLQKVIDADRAVLAGYWNEKIIPALVRLGVLPDGLTFQFQQEEDIEKLWGMVKDLLLYKNIPNEWIKEKFGIEVQDKPQPEHLASYIAPTDSKDKERNLFAPFIRLFAKLGKQPQKDFFA